MTTNVTEKLLLERLERHHWEGQWAFFPHIRIGMKRNARIIDAMAISLRPSLIRDYYPRVAYEIKLNRADFLAEISKPEKRQLAMSVSNRFYFVTPPGLVSPAELPAQAGLIEIPERGRLRVIVEAVERSCEPPTMELLVAVARYGAKPRR